MTKQEAIENMCNKCSNHEMCMGTGCADKKRLQEDNSQQFKIAMINITNLIGFGCKEDFLESIKYWLKKLEGIYYDK